MAGYFLDPRDTWHEVGKEPPPPRKLTLEDKFNLLRWATVDWGDKEPPPDKPYAVAKSQMYANGHVFTVWKLNTGQHVFDHGYRNEWSTPGGKTGS